MSEKKVVGIAGTFASGKDTLAEHLAANFKFMHVSTGDIIRAETMEKYGNSDRPTLMKHANDMRHERGPGVLVEIAIERFKASGDQFSGLVVSGIRSIGEAESLKADGGKLIWVDSEIRTRYERAYMRERDVEKGMTFDEFVASEKMELEKPIGNKEEQNLNGVSQLADHRIMNDGTTEEYLQEGEEILGLAA